MWMFFWDGWLRGFFCGVRGEDNTDELFFIMALLLFTYFAVYIFLYIFKEFLCLLQLLKKKIL